MTPSWEIPAPSPPGPPASPSAAGDRTAWWIGAVALAGSLFFCLVVYPAAHQSVGARIDPDQWATMGMSLWKNGVLAYYPGTDPTIYRAPAYPAFLSLVLSLGGERLWPVSVQVAQCGLFAGTCVLTLALGRELFGRRVGTAAAAAAAVHPLLIWYTSRFWVESLAAFLFTLLLYAAARCARGGGPALHAAAGLVLGACILLKSVFLPFLALIPAGLLLARGRGAVGRALLLAVAAGCVVAPWTARNLRLTGAFVPVHVGAGINLEIADCTVRAFPREPFAYGPAFLQCKDEFTARHAGDSAPGTALSEHELALDRAGMRKYLDAYARDPGFLLYKMGFNAVMFWVLSDTLVKSLGLALLQVPLVLLGGAGLARAVRRCGWRSASAMLLFLILGFYLLHLPINAVARYSAVLLPVLLVFGASVLAREPGPGAGQPAGRTALFHG